MAKMLDVSILQDDRVQYNDDIEYVEGDDIYNPTKDISPETYSNEINYSNFIVHELGTPKYSPKLITHDVEYEPSDLSYMTSVVECKYYDLNLNILKDFNNIQITKYDEISLEMFNKLKDHRYDGVTYYATTDTLIIPQAIDFYIKKGETVHTKIALYNMDKIITPHKIFGENFLIKRPRLNFQYIPQIIKHSILTEEKYGIISAPNSNYFDYAYIYKNLPREYFKDISIDSKTLAYDVNDEYFHSHSDTNQTKINTLCKDIAMNGFKQVIQLKVMQDGTLISYFSNKRLLMGLYLNCPTIPVCIIYDPFVTKGYMNYYTPKPDIDKINKLLSPYIILG